MAGILITGATGNVGIEVIQSLRIIDKQSDIGEIRTFVPDVSNLQPQISKYQHVSIPIRTNFHRPHRDRYNFSGLSCGRNALGCSLYGRKISGCVST